MKKKVIIIGGGFGGLTVAKVLRRSRRNLDITLIDSGKYFNFLPLLPDVLGRGLRRESLVYSFRDLSIKYKFNFINEEVKHLDLINSVVSTLAKDIPYDYLVISSGSSTNFYRNAILKEIAYRLDNIDDALKIKQALKDNKFDSCIIFGGGYTGVEVATNLRRYFIKNRLSKKVIIVERASSILGALPEWMKQYVLEDFKRLDIEVLLNCSFVRQENSMTYLSCGRQIKNTMLVWVAGVECADFIKELHINQSPQHRIDVNQYLQITNNCFAIGDAANFTYQGKPLRMAVQFSINEGIVAARNIICSEENIPLKQYKPVDLGYIIPMANNRSCGIVLGMKIKGLLATFFHYIICIYRSVGINKIKLTGDLIKGGAA